MSSLIISSASRSSPFIFIYHSSHIILIPSSFYSCILAFFTFPLIHFTMVLFAISSKLIFTHFIYHTLLFIIPSSFPSYFNSITLITTHFFTHLCSLSIHFHPFPSHYSSQPLQSHLLLVISISILSFHSIASFSFISNSFFDLSFFHDQWYTRPPLSLSLVSSILILIPFFSILIISFISFLRFSVIVSQLWDKYLVCSDSRYPILIWCVDRKHSQSVRRNCFCFLCMIREQ